MSVPLDEMPTSDPAWGEWFAVQDALRTKVTALLTDGLAGRHREFKAAVFSAVIEDLAEQQRMFLHLSGQTVEPP